MIANAAPSGPTQDHASYLGGSDVAAIVGIDPFRTPLDVWGAKTRRIVTVASEAMHSGNDHEESIVRTYRRRCEGELDSLMYPGPGTLRSRVEPWRAATPDALADKGLDREHVPLSLRDRKGGDLSEWPLDLRVRQFPEVRS
jgi:hypothetical protein